MNANKILVLFVLLWSAAGVAAEGPAYLPSDLYADDWYPSNLRAMKEPSLYRPLPNAPTEEYRFLWLRSFDEPIAVRVTKENLKMSLRVVRLRGAAGYPPPGRIEADRVIPVNANEWKRLHQLLKGTSFWSMPMAERPDPMGLDGAQWVLEGRVGDRYHVIDRWSPQDSMEPRGLRSYVACCKYFLEMAGLQIPDGKIY